MVLGSYLKYWKYGCFSLYSEVQTAALHRPQMSTLQQFCQNGSFNSD
jgi:hypothetical protein